MVIIGKREFTLHSSKYIKRVEETGEELIITHQNEPRLKIIPLHPKTIKNLAGTITRIKIEGDINDPVLPPLDRWSS